MKTSNIIITFAAILLFSSISKASSQNNLFVSVSRTSDLFPIMIASDENDPNSQPMEEKNPKAKNTLTLDSALPTVSEEISFDYLRFDVTKFINEDPRSENTEMPDDALDYLRFDVTVFTEQNPVDMDQLPVNEFEYLRFSVTDFYSTEQLTPDGFGELPVAE